MDSRCGFDLSFVSPEPRRAQTEQSGKNSKVPSFRGTLRAEDSLFLCRFTPREIPRFVRNDCNRFFHNEMKSVPLKPHTHAILQYCRPIFVHRYLELRCERGRLG